MNKDILLSLTDCNFSYKQSKNLNIKKGKLTSNQDVLTLQNINLELNKNLIYGVVGKNGSGKSTLLKLLFDVLEPNDGYVSRNYSKGKLLDGATVFHNELSAVDNLKAMHILEFDGDNEKEDFKKRLQLLKDVSGLDLNDLEKPVSLLSSGTKSKVGFGLTMSFLENIDFLGLDEYFSFGDEEYKKFSSQYIKNKLTETGSAIVISHSMEMLKNMCDKIIFIENGIISKIGNPEEVIESYRETLKK